MIGRLRIRRFLQRPIEIRCLCLLPARSFKMFNITPKYYCTTYKKGIFLHVIPIRIIVLLEYSYSVVFFFVSKMDFFKTLKVAKPVFTLFKVNNGNTRTIRGIYVKLAIFDNCKLFKINEKCFLFHLKSSFRSQNIYVFVMTFSSCRKTARLER